jgi:ABC-2 type transport system ATP-binding protein
VATSSEEDRVPISDGQEALRPLGNGRGPHALSPEALRPSGNGRGPEPLLPLEQESPAIRVDGLTKQYNQVEAVRHISFEVAPGEMFAFLGPNGAGKTTTISMLCTLTRPTGGHAWVAGFDVVRDQAEVRRRIGLVFQESTLDEYLTAEENLRFHAELYGLERHSMRTRLQQVLEMVGLWERRGDQVRTFSGGMKRRLEIARGLLHSPRVLFLDEPTIGLDPQTRAHIWDYIRELKRRETITMFLTSHYMDEAENCDRIAIIDQGEIVALDTPAALKASVGRDRIEIRTADDDAAIAALAERFGLEASKAEDAVRVYVADGEEFVPRLFAELGVPIRAVNIARPTLDDVFMSYTGRTIRDAEASASDRAAGDPWRRQAQARARR